MKRLLLAMLVALGSQGVWAQSQTVKGTVTDKTGEPIIGATIQVKGTKIAAVTDLDGHFTLSNVPDGAYVDISYVGMKSQSLKAGSNMSISLDDDSKMLDEVVAIGYGSAKAKDLTSPIAVVKAEDIASVPASSPMAAMQGKVAGVNVVSNGTPGAGPTVRIRGNGSFSNSNPLYVVDGMFYDNIDFLNTSDIKEMSVLKDASAAAIYGVRAANGVVIITTKNGSRNQKTQISYDGYVGVQKATNKLKMANSSQYAQMLMEANYDTYSPYFKASIDRYGGSYAYSDFHNWTYGSDTDWYSELLRDAVITNHSVTISGGGEKASYSVGGSYLYQNGIMDTKNDYGRLNFRAALDYDATSWLKVGFNSVYSRSNQNNPNSAAWQQAFNASGIYPVYDENNTAATPEKFAAPSSVGFTNNFYNPVATAYYYKSKNRTQQFLNSYYADFTILPSRLHFKSAVSYDHSTVEGYVFQPKYYISEQLHLDNNGLTKSMTTYNNYVWDNTLSYNDSWGKHNFGLMLGQSMREEKYHILYGYANNVPEDEEQYWYVNQGDENTRKSSEDAHRYRGLSWFGRLNYNYAGKYYLMFTFRADGSSKYQEHWGYFPSIGASWVVSEEPFFKNNIKGIDYLKIRASWGKLGNDHVAASDGFASITTGNSASGVFGNTTIPGYQNTTYFSWLKWELVEETNIGLALNAFHNRLSFDADYYHRMTKNAVISTKLPFQNETLAGNYGKILNQGFDITAGWSDNIGKDFKYNIGANLSFLWNEVKSLNGVNMVNDGKTYNIVGEEMNSFYGYKVIGIYQNQAQIDADPIAKANGCEPGDLENWMVMTARSSAAICLTLLSVSTSGWNGRTLTLPSLHTDRQVHRCTTASAPSATHRVTSISTVHNMKTAGRVKAQPTKTHLQKPLSKAGM